MPRTILSMAAAVLVLAGCATPGPYAEVTGERINRADPNEEDVLILGVDGQLELSATKTIQVEPGVRTMLLGTARLDRRGESASGVVPLNAKACLRYHFVARHESMSQIQPWKLVLKNVEPIPECVSKYPGSAPVPSAAASRPAG